MIKLYGQIVPKRLFGTARVERKAHNNNFQAKNAEPSLEDQVVVPDKGYDALSLVTVKAATLQEKTVTPSSAEQTVVPDVGVYGLAKVIVKAQGNHGLLQNKNVLPSVDQQVITPDPGYYGLQEVVVMAAPLDNEVAYPGAESQTIRPSEGNYGLESVFIAGDFRLIPENIRAGVTIFGVTGTYTGDGGGSSGGGTGGGDYGDALVDYNGVKLPDVSPYITEKHPDAVILKIGSTYNLIVIGGDYWIVGDALTLATCVCSISITYALSSDGLSWVKQSEDNSTEYVTVKFSDYGARTIVWSNFEIVSGTGSPNHNPPEDDTGNGGNSGSGSGGNSGNYPGVIDPDSWYDPNAVAYLYNGVRLPVLPEWDRERYPYVVMIHGDDGEYGSVYALSTPHHLTTFGIGIGVSKGEMYLVSNWGGFLGPEPFIPFEEKTATDTNNFGTTPNWANYDVLTNDGTLYLSASEPIPVYE